MLPALWDDTALGYFEEEVVTHLYVTSISFANLSLGFPSYFVQHNEEKHTWAFSARHWRASGCEAISVWWWLQWHIYAFSIPSSGLPLHLSCWVFQVFGFKWLQRAKKWLFKPFLHGIKKSVTALACFTFSNQVYRERFQGFSSQIWHLA